MSLDTPRKRKRREKLIKKFSEDWEVELKTNPTIKYKKKSGFSGLWQKYFGRKHSVFSMYWFFKHEYRNNEDARKFYFPLEHDNIPVKDIPFKYELKGTWSIEEEDLKYLFGGPLIDQHAELLVSADTSLNKFVRFCQVATPPVALLSAVFGVILKWPSIILLF